MTREVATPDVDESLPKYIQIANHIRDRILQGDLRPGDEIPSERQIVAEWGVSRPTATKALGALRATGFVDARQGSGTFVRENPQLNRRARDRYARSRETGKVYPGDEWAEIVAADRAPAPAEVAEALGLQLGAPALKRTRLIRDAAGPIELSTSWFPEALAATAPRLLEADRIREGTLAYVERVTGRRARMARDWIGARRATADEAGRLGLGRNAAVLVVDHTTFDAEDAPIEFVQAVYPPNRRIFEQQYGLPGRSGA